MSVSSYGQDQTYSQKRFREQVMNQPCNPLRIRFPPKKKGLQINPDPEMLTCTVFARLWRDLGVLFTKGVN
jgi:hypothetical protein